ncbi:MAG: hypothetical protein HY709_03340, partial [Candidatus Latescibacteria bacterium]|nr:hypothetical protein [Candidatus Latescibacterota bacterium]
MKLPTGDYTVEVRKEGYATQQMPIIIQETPQDISFNLEGRGGVIIIALSDSGEWEKAVTELNGLLDTGVLSQDEQTMARKVLGLTYISLGQGENAVKVFKEIVRDPLRFDKNVLGNIVSPEANKYLGQAIMAVRLEEIEARKALRSRLSRGGSFIRSTVLPGWGQRYQGYNNRGYLMAGMAVASITYAAITQRDYWKAQDRYEKAP